MSIDELMQQADRLYGFALARVHDHHVAEDLVQDCLLAAWERRATFDGRSSLSTWLIGILKFKVIDHHRRSRRTPTDQAVGSTEADRDPLDELFDAHGSWTVDPRAGLELFVRPPDRADLAGEIMAWIRFCLDKLPERLRLLFTLREMEELDVATAASAAGVTPGSAAVLLTRTRHQLRLCLQRQGVRP
jgi:RNA polymerase sigma factor (sigma-70 family)